MTDQTCGTCRFRGEALTFTDEDDDFKEKQTDYFLCGQIKHYRGSGWGYERPPRAEVGSSYVVDGSGYHAALCVAEDFGCNRWAPIAESPEKV